MKMGKIGYYFCLPNFSWQSFIHFGRTASPDTSQPDLLNWPPDSWITDHYQPPSQSEIISITGGLIVFIFLAACVLLTHLFELLPK